MARRTESKPEVGAPPPIPPGPWPAPPKERRPRLGWAALALALVVAVGFGGWLVFGRQSAHHKPTGSNSASSPSVSAPALPPPVPATTYQAFAALPAGQQQAVMQQVMNRYDAVIAQAYRTLDGSLLPLVATGDQLGVVQGDFDAVKKAGYPLSDQNQVSILQVLLSPQPYSFVSVHIQSTGVDQYLDPGTLQPVGTPSTSSGTSSFSFVIEGGTWMASEHFQDISR